MRTMFRIEKKNKSERETDREKGREKEWLGVKKKRNEANKKN